MTLRTLFLYSPGLFLRFLLSACTMGRDYRPPAMETFTAPSFKAAQAARIATGQPVAAWWRELEDEALSRLVEQALVHNHDVRLARAETGLALGVVNIYKTLGGGWEAVKAPEVP